MGWLSARKLAAGAKASDGAAADAAVFSVEADAVDSAEVEAGLRRQAAERSAERKVLLHLVPVMFLFSLVNYIDRANLAFAAVSLEKDLGLNNRVFGLAGGVFFATYASLQIPSQLATIHLGGRRMLALLAVAWGAVASGMAGVRSEGGLLAQRVLLGAAEAGALPAMWMVNSQWFPTFRLTIPSTCVMMAITVAQAISGPLAAGLLSLEGHIGSLKGYEILFLFEGIPAIILGICIFLFLPDSPAHAWFLTAEEKEAWLAAIALTDSSDKHGTDGGWEALKSALSCRVVYCSGVWRGFYATALYGVLYFSPLIIREIFGNKSASAAHTALLTSIPFVLGAVAHAANALHSSATGERRHHIATPWVFGGVAMALAPVCLIKSAPKAAFALFIVASVGINASDGPDVSWVTSLMSGKQRALGLATVNMLANIGGFVGPYVLGALSTSTGSFQGGMWFVAASITIAGTLVLLFPLSWATHCDKEVMEGRAASALELRRASRVLSHTASNRNGAAVGGAGSGGSWFSTPRHHRCGSAAASPRCSTAAPPLTECPSGNV